MPVNIYSFFIANTLAAKAFDEKGVPNPDRAKQLGLFAALFSPSNGGGLGSAVLPAVIVQQTAIREADAAAAVKAKEAAAALIEYPDKRGDKSPSAAAAQRELKALGFSNVVVDGTGTKKVVTQNPDPTPQRLLNRDTPITLGTETPSG
jgi:peptidoglycan hydrolase-like protein with peptidoglycan-binding domain